MSRRVTIAEIAERAGVSVSTVSKVLNGRPGVGAARRDKILAILEDTSYRRRGEGRRSRSGLIDVVLADVYGLWSARILFGAEGEASRAGVALVVSALHNRTLGNKHWVEKFKERRSDGLVVVASKLRPELGAELRRLRVPYVVLDPLGAIPEAVPTICSTNFAGARDATRHLIDLGHRRIAVMTGPSDLPYSQERLDGYRAALARAGIDFDDDLVRHGHMDEESGYRLGCSLLELPDPPTAVFTGSDLHAHGLYTAAREHNVAIPRKLSVVGFDNLQSGEWCSPKLTTVNQPLEAMGTLAIRILVSMSRGVEEPVGRRMELATTLVVRESTAPPPPGR
ncbi:hypothetical protein BW730_07200 [Tessaracoccus aquimaris]|uniref:Uncharacterized protein n=1 Tax=Tessaracoccus aquimaris TaxID=1332264 RepID=A0A1Q2CMH9_9ACTN|nr:substrate-binding domain-containing protein [Tessaracoccus aquimaris]AQP47319.1 hypothetical protein BW730_07200 [Tessaracoccus aquimaris]